MIKFSSRIAGLALTLLPIGLLPANGAPAGQQESIPQLGSAYYAWSKTDNAFQPIPGAGPGPVVQDPAHPTGRGHPIRIADLNNPILKPWAIEKMREKNELAASGKEAYEAHASCQPGGVPYFLVSGARNPMYIVQGAREVVLINEGFAEVRHIFLNVPHSAHPTPSPYGESVGHYEGGTLVVDTIGLSGDTYIDNYRTPHTMQEHVVERFRVINDRPGTRPPDLYSGGVNMVDEGKTLEVDIHVDDPGAFNMPWSARQTYRSGVSIDSFHGKNLEGQMLEAPCEQNKLIEGATVSPVPVADKADF